MRDVVIRSLVLWLAALVPVVPRDPAPRAQTPVTHVLFITMDGMRWQEVFAGMDPALLTKPGGGVSDPAPLQARFGANTPERRRERLMPFFWNSVAAQGQVFGDPSSDSTARVTNGLRFSYPGYSEMLVGFADPRINSNDRVPNPNETVLEWLAKQRGFGGRIAAFASWELLPWIVNQERSGIPCNGDGLPIAHPRNDRERAIDDFSAELPPYWGETRFDAPTQFGALEYLRRNHPRVLYVMLGETDEWAHGRRYDLYLDAAQRNDRFIRQIWTAAQSIHEYAGHTALVLATDHGRGETAKDWTDHGEKVPAAERIWIAVMGPGVRPLGVRRGISVTQSQIASTIASLLGQDYARAQPKAAAPLPLQ
jgi:hypothetical protein